MQVDSAFQKSLGATKNRHVFMKQEKYVAENMNLRFC